MKTCKQVVGFTKSGNVKLSEATSEYSKELQALGFIALSNEVFDRVEDRINNGESLDIEVLGKDETISGQPALVHFEEDDFVIEEISYE